MKSITDAMKAHLASRATTLCTCWKIVRKDGNILGFTDHDRDVVYQGITYESQQGYNRSAVANDGSWSVDNLDVTGFLDSENITDADVRNGAFNFAEVYIFAVNWKDLSTNMGEIKLRRGWFGEATITDDGQFTIELRGLTQALSHVMIENFSPECRADFCDTRCKLDINKFMFTAVVTDSGDQQTSFTASYLGGSASGLSSTIAAISAASDAATTISAGLAALTSDVADNDTWSGTEKSRYVTQIDTWNGGGTGSIIQITNALTSAGMTTEATNLTSLWATCYAYFVQNRYNRTDKSDSIQKSYFRTTTGNVESALNTASTNLGAYQPPSGSGPTLATTTGTAIPNQTYATSKGPHTAWALKIEVTDNPAIVQIAEVRFFDQSGEIVTPKSAGAGSATGSTNEQQGYDDGHGPGKLIDGNMNSYYSLSYDPYASTDGNTKNSSDPTTVAGERIYFVFDSAVDIKEVEVVTSGTLGTGPTAFRIEYADASSPDVNTAWDLALECTANWTQSGQSGVWGIGSTTSDPLNYAATPQNMPTPYTGASTFVGGYIRWTTGRNKGRAVEITEFTAGANSDVIGLFERMIYPIAPGDVFTIAQGCLKSADACGTYRNIVNFRGEPFVPGQDEYLSYPDAQSS